MGEIGTLDPLVERLAREVCDKLPISFAEAKITVEIVLATLDPILALAEELRDLPLEKDDD